MRIKFSVGVSEAEEDRRRLEELRRQSGLASLASVHDDPEARPPGWPAAPDEVDDETASPAVPLWAW
jgi:hypothetical protein